MNPELAYFEPWMAVIGFCVLCAAIIHKRFFFESATGASALRQFLLPALLHFLPAAVALFVMFAVTLRVSAEMGRPMSGLIAQFLMLAGVFILVEVLLHAELRHLRKELTKW